MKTPLVGLRYASFILVVTLSSPGVTMSASQQQPAAGTPEVRTTEIAPKFYLLSDGQTNMLLVLGEESSFVAGVPSPALVGAAAATAERVGKRPIKYALMVDDDRAVGLGDGGWGRRGAVTLVHEGLYGRMKQQARKANGGGRGQAAAGAASVLPAMSFSQVVQLRFADEDTHIIHERAGYTDADVLIHFEDSGVLYLGPSFTNDGYPAIDATRGGQLTGLIQTADFFVTNFAQVPQALEPIVPGRGPVATFRDLKDYRDMLIATRDRVKAMRDAGQSLDAILAAKPTAAFDARWGAGPVTPRAFVTEVYESLSTAARTQP